MCPFLASYGEVTGDEEAFDEATRQIRVQAKHLQDPHTDLFRHEMGLLVDESYLEAANRAMSIRTGGD